jgi:hypothetical protein
MRDVCIGCNARHLQGDYLIHSFFRTVSRGRTQTDTSRARNKKGSTQIKCGVRNINSITKNTDEFSIAHTLLYDKNANVMDAANEFGVGLYNMWGLGWRSGKGTALPVGGSRDRSSVAGVFFPGHILGSIESLKMNTRIFLGVKTAGA